MADSCRGGEEVFGIFYTGGTTGQPKGVIGSGRRNRQWVRERDAIRADLPLASVEHGQRS